MVVQSQMEIKPIKEFVQDILNDEISERLITNWNKELELGGYYQVRMPPPLLGDEVRMAVEWCREHFDSDHYYWTGGAFWFEREGDATLFALRWL